MSSVAHWGVWAGVGSLICLVAWVGWRFFLVSTDRAGIGLPSSQGGGATGLFRAFSLVMRPSRSLLNYSLLGILIGGSVAFGVFSVSGAIVPDPLLIQEWSRQAHIQGALNPERLVPPPAFPPSLFVGSERLALETADRDWSRLDPRFLQPVLRLLERLEGRGYVFALLEGYRSPGRQEKLADLGAHVTNARAYQSKHQFGLAVDLAPVRDGRLVISERDPWAMKAYVALGEEAEKAGLVWGGRWWFKDYGHVEAVAP